MLESRKCNPKKAAVWSLGIILYLLLHRVMPFCSSEECRFKELNVEDTEDLVFKMLKKEPNERIPLERVLAHPFLQIKEE